MENSTIFFFNPSLITIFSPLSILDTDVLNTDLIFDVVFDIILVLLLQLWEDSKTENSRLKAELSEVKRDLESITSQLEAMAIQVSINKI